MVSRRQEQRLQIRPYYPLPRLALSKEATTKSMLPIRYRVLVLSRVVILIPLTLDAPQGHFQIELTCKVELSFRKPQSQLDRGSDPFKMSAVITSAPAKVILFGDHFVVHGATALTTALDLRTFVRVQASTGTTTPSIHIVLPDINVDVTVPLASLQYSGA